MTMPTKIIGIEIPPLPTDPRALTLFNLNFPVTLQPETTDGGLSVDERKWCTQHILGVVNEMIVNSNDPYAQKFNLYIASRIVDIAAVDATAQDAPGAKDVLQDAMCYTDGNIWGIGDPASTNAPPNYIPGMHSSGSINKNEDGYEYPPGNNKYSGPYSAFTVMDSKGTKGPPQPY
jgi:hypothetical protein